MLSNLSGWHALVILTIVLLVFGSAKLPALAKSFGESMRILKDEAGTRSDSSALRDGSAVPSNYEPTTSSVTRQTHEGGPTS